MLNRKTKRSPITRPMFHKINRSVRQAINSYRYNAHAIGLGHGVSDETVRAVRRARTWPNYVASKKARRKAIAGRPQLPVDKSADLPVKVATLTKLVEELMRFKDDLFEREVEKIIGKPVVGDDILERVERVEERIGHLDHWVSKLDGAVKKRGFWPWGRR